MIAALFVETGGAYFGLEGVDPWDMKRDAMQYAGPWPVVAHPPCARWCRLARLVESRGGKRAGDDGGTFASALATVRRYGGVLEHPAYSRAWATFGLPAPHPEGWQRTICGGWVAQVEQAHYGHKARKATWLYAVRCDWLPSLRWGAAQGVEFGMSSLHSTKKGPRLPEIRKSLRSRTPDQFRDLLIGMARSVSRPLFLGADLTAAPAGEVDASSTALGSDSDAQQASSGDESHPSPVEHSTTLGGQVDHFKWSSRPPAVVE